MNPNIPFYITALLFLIVGLILYSIFYAVNYGLNKQEIPKPKKTRALIMTGVLLIGWLAVTAVVALRGSLLDFTSTPPRIITLIIPPVLTIIYLSNSVRVNNLLEVIPASWLVYVQSFRILMELFLWLMFMQNIIPKQMTFEGINYDVLAGLSAPLIAYYSLSEGKWPRIVAILWNIAGFLLVANITIVSILSAPGPLRQFFNEPSNTMVAYFPFVWVAAFIVPFAFLMHVLSVKQIIRNYN